MSADDRQRDPITQEPLGSDPVPLGSTVARDDSSEQGDAGLDRGDAPARRDPDDDAPLPDDGLS